MNTLRKWTPISCALLSIAAYSVAITGSANAQTESKMMMITKAAPHKVLSTIPAPQSGIKLIEYISQRMHTLRGPVIAAKTATYSYSPPQEKSQGPTDRMLALRPPVSGYIGAREQDRESSSDKKSNEEQKLKRKADDAGRSDKPTLGDDNSSGSYIAGGTLSYQRRQIAMNNSMKSKEGAIAARSESTASSYGRMANGRLGKSLAGFGGSLQQLDEGMRQAEAASKEISTKSRAKTARPEVSYQIASGGKAPSGMWEAPVRGVLLQQQGLNNSANVKDARTSAAAGAGSSDMAAAEPQSPPMPAAYYRNNYRRLPSTNMGQHAYQPGDNQYSSGIAGGSNVRDYRNAPLSTIASAAAPSAAPLPAQQGQSFMVPPPPAVNDGITQNSNLNAYPKQKSEIAMLAPNVIMGIPLVRLGSSAIEANKALTSIKGNKLKQQSISGWTVYVLHKANSAEPAMQVYVRHGLVEALRIFDNAFIAPDFGVQLNDDLSKVKAKFGEPTFMIPEPDCPSAKNYVYPISQVSFELSWPSNSPTPKVASVLIFTVK
ncbi:hypothetical protein BH10CYA1_BH10CYA1_26890 [soil metagenome]